MKPTRKEIILIVIYFILIYFELQIFLGFSGRDALKIRYRKLTQ